jgi:hypothetical protein
LIYLLASEAPPLSSAACYPQDLFSFTPEGWRSWRLQVMASVREMFVLLVYGLSSPLFLLQQDGARTPCCHGLKVELGKGNVSGVRQPSSGELYLLTADPNRRNWCLQCLLIQYLF